MTCSPPATQRDEEAFRRTGRVRAWHQDPVGSIMLRPGGSWQILRSPVRRVKQIYKIMMENFSSNWIIWCRSADDGWKILQIKFILNEHVPMAHSVTFHERQPFHFTHLGGGTMHRRLLIQVCSQQRNDVQLVRRFLFLYDDHRMVKSRPTQQSPSPSFGFFETASQPRINPFIHFFKLLFCKLFTINCMI